MVELEHNQVEIRIIAETEKLKNQLAWYQSFFDNAADAILIVQPETWCVLDANPHAATLLDIPFDQILGVTLPQFRRIYKLLSKAAVPTVMTELSFATANGNVVAEVSARFAEYNGQTYIQAIARDVSEQLALSDKLVQADKMVLLGQLSAGIAHEIRNPLAAINLNLQFLQRKVSPESGEYSYICSALLGVERITKIVEATLNFSRTTQPITKREQLNTIILNSIELATTSFRRKTITMKTELQSDLPEVMIDTSQIQQVIINLFTNAADAIKAKGTISISSYTEATARGDGRMAVMAITDTGSGMTTEEISKIFIPFYTRKPEGTGLGLPISQQIIHQHDGIIDVESVPNQGTTFFVKLPIPNSLKPN